MCLCQSAGARLRRARLKRTAQSPTSSQLAGSKNPSVKPRNPTSRCGIARVFPVFRFRRLSPAKLCNPVATVFPPALICVLSEWEMRTSTHPDDIPNLGVVPSLVRTASLGTAPNLRPSRSGEVRPFARRHPVSKIPCHSEPAKPEGNLLPASTRQNPRPHNVGLLNRGRAALQRRVSYLEEMLALAHWLRTSIARPAFSFYECHMNSSCGKRTRQPRIKPVIVEDTTYSVSLLTGTISGSNFAIP
jgi:hypothetical protein